MYSYIEVEVFRVYVMIVSGELSFYFICYIDGICKEKDSYSYKIRHLLLLKVQNVIVNKVLRTTKVLTKYSFQIILIICIEIR